MCILNARSLNITRLTPSARAACNAKLVVLSGRRKGKQQIEGPATETVRITLHAKRSRVEKEAEKGEGEGGGSGVMIAATPKLVKRERVKVER